MLGSPRLLAVRLAPSVGQSRFYATPQEFCMVWMESTAWYSLRCSLFKVADCLFFNACATADSQEHAVVSVN